MIFLPVQILVQSDFPLHLKIKKNVRQKKGFFTISIFNLKLLWYFCFRCFFYAYQKMCIFWRPLLTSWKIEDIFKDLWASEESAFWPVGTKFGKFFFKSQPFRIDRTDFWVQHVRMFLRSSSLKNRSHIGDSFTKTGLKRSLKSA